jgi:hypothetical protein
VLGLTAGKVQKSARVLGVGIVVVAGGGGEMRAKYTWHLVAAGVD